ncbi:hypothetical protein QPL79_04880 [Ignisphaera sp. 4213-co]|uniref:Type IV pilin n=1 Tax=Ignisphaera cupida TaxID=3050454 RepID=A0ABD4Z6E7_9CREN|nr:hypothetical protein [Ignisphaera sp. 4213-co]MDK6028689.1 hypothetical protein [Ignisphaera sp. 4213-co]
MKSISGAAVGLSHTVLGIIAFLIFTTLMFSVVFSTIQTLYQVNNIPLISVFAQAFKDLETANTTVAITIRHEGGAPEEIRYIAIYDGGKWINISNLNMKNSCVAVETNGLYSNVIYPGQYTIELVFNNTCYSFEYGKSYSGFIVFSNGIYPFSFTPMYIAKPLKNAKPFCDTAFMNVIINSRNVENLVKNFDNWIAKGAEVVYTGESLIVKDSTKGLGFTYYNLNVETNLTQGSWIVSRMTLVNVTEDVGGCNNFVKWGIGIYFKFKESQPKEEVVFIGIEANACGSKFAIEDYVISNNRYSLVSSVNIDGKNINSFINKSFILIAYVQMDKNKNFLNVTAVLFDEREGSRIASVNGVVKLPGTPGVPWEHTLSLAVDYATARYDLLVLLPKYLSPYITISSIPNNYIIEIFDSATNNQWSCVIGANCTIVNNSIVTPFVYLEKGSVITVRYPALCGKPIAIRFISPTSIEPTSLVIFSRAKVYFKPVLDGNIAIVNITLPYINNSISVVGFVANNITNRNKASVRIRLSLDTEHSFVRYLKANISIINSKGISITQKSIAIDNGFFTSNTSDWSISIGGGESAYMYINGYFTSKLVQESKIVLYISIYIESESTEIPIKINLVTIYVKPYNW